MRNSIQRRGRISRTFVPSATVQQPSNAANSSITEQPYINYFYKIKGNVKLLQTYDFDHQFKRRSDHSFTHNRFRLSKRMEQLSRTRPVHQNSHDEQQAKETHRRRASSQRGVTGIRDGVYEMEIANINKTISGTRLGALSALQIMEEMENENQLQGSTFNGFDNLVKRMDSEIIEDPNNQGKGKQVPIRKASTIDGNLPLQKRINAIYGGEDSFLDKYREYQISLLEKIPSYRSRHLTLDYKNQWRI